MSLKMGAMALNLVYREAAVWLGKEPQARISCQKLGPGISTLLSSLYMVQRLYMAITSVRPYEDLEADMVLKSIYKYSKKSKETKNHNQLMCCHCSTAGSGYRFLYTEYKVGLIKDLINTVHLNS